MRVSRNADKHLPSRPHPFHLHNDASFRNKTWIAGALQPKHVLHDIDDPADSSEDIDGVIIPAIAGKREKLSIYERIFHSVVYMCRAGNAFCLKSCPHEAQN